MYTGIQKSQSRWGRISNEQIGRKMGIEGTVDLVWTHPEDEGWETDKEGEAMYSFLLSEAGDIERKFQEEGILSLR